MVNIVPIKLGPYCLIILNCGMIYDDEKKHTRNIRRFFNSNINAFPSKRDFCC